MDGELTNAAAAVAALEGKLVVIGDDASEEPCEEELQRRPGARGVDVAGARGQVVAWLDEADKYLVQTFSGEYARLAVPQLTELAPQTASAAPDASSAAAFDAAFPASPHRDGIFLEELLEALHAKGYCTIQMTSRPSARKTALFEAEDSSRWERPIPEFESSFMGRSTGGKRVMWLKDESEPRLPQGEDGLSEEDGLAAFDALLHELANLVIPHSPDLGFVASSRTNGMLHTTCSPEEEAELLESQQTQAAITSQDLVNHLAFSNRRKLAMMYFVHGGGGMLTLHPPEEEEDDEANAIRIPCNENQVVIFRHDLMDYTFEPGGKQLAIQAWILRGRLEGEAGLEEQRADLEGDGLRDRRGQLLPVGPTYFNSQETVDCTALACRVNGNIWNPEDYWCALTSCTDAVTVVPLARWDHDLYYSDNPNERTKGYVRHFGFLETEQLSTFDHAFFGLKPEQAEKVDPCQRVGLEVAYECLFRAGWTKDILEGSELVACYAYTPSEWTGNAIRGSFSPGPSSELFQENTSASCAARLHYSFGMTGPTSTVETACSSSLTATALMHSHMRPPRADHMRASMMRQHRHGIAVGMNAYFDPFYTIGLCGASMLTHMGRCFTFDGSADGFVRGEGFTSMHYRVSEGEDLSRLAMLCGTCMNQDGRSASLTAPHGPSQQECIRHSLREAGIKSLDIQIQELHGTGTPLGDPIEVGALRATMMTYQGEIREHPLVKTSSKSNIGHTELNAGSCGIMKCVLMGLYCTATPNVHMRLLNPHIDAHGYPVYFTSEPVDQGKNQGFHGVSSFGFGGSNARGDIWARAQAGARNTQPDGMLLDLSRERLSAVEEFYGARCLPLPAPLAADARSSDPASRGRGAARGGAQGAGQAALAAAPQDAMGFSGNYLTGGAGDLRELKLAVAGSFNGWGAAQRMDFDEDRQIHTFAFRLGETRAEHFRISCEGLGDIFPATPHASMDALVLGPGSAPPRHAWLVDGRDEQAPAGTVYRVTLKWDSASGRKQISWMPSTDPRSLELAAATPFQHKYFVVASWNSWAPTEMSAVKGEPGAFEIAVRIGLSGCEEFHFLRNGDASQALYPARSCSASGGSPEAASVAVRGPDHRGSGKHWRVAGNTGERVSIRLQVANGDVEVVVAGPQSRSVFKNLQDARRSFSVWSSAGAGFTSMKSESPDVHTAVLTVGIEGYEEFQIVADEDPDQAIYPEMPGAGQGLSLALGPDTQGGGMYWGITADTGDRVEIKLNLAQADKRQLVTWRFVSLPEGALENG